MLRDHCRVSRGGTLPFSGTTRTKAAKTISLCFRPTTSIPSKSARRVTQRVKLKVEAFRKVWVAPPTEVAGIPASASLEAIGLRLVSEAVLTVLAVLAGRAAIIFFEERLRSSLSESSGKPARGLRSIQKGWMQLALSLFSAALEPAKLLLLPVAGARVAWLALVYVHITVLRMKCAGHFMQMCCDELRHNLMYAEAATMKLIELAAILAVVWFTVRWKDEVVGLLLRNARAGRLPSTPASGGGDDDAGLTDTGEGPPSVPQMRTAEHLLVPLSSLASWLIIIGGGMSALYTLGIDLRPLTAVGGLSTVALGFASQSVAQNAVSAINLFITRPFIVGEHVTLRTATGAVVMSGKVHAIYPMHTLVISPENKPVALPNRVVTEMIIVNDSRERRR